MHQHIGKCVESILKCYSSTCKDYIMETEVSVYQTVFGVVLIWQGSGIYV